MAKRAVLYARVSGDDRGKEGRNLAGQLEMCREYAQRHGYQIVAELQEDDRGASGARIDLPELSRTRDLAQAGEYDTLVVREIDRLSRNLAKQLIVEEELKRAGVGIEYVLGEYPDTPEGRLNKHIKATIAEYEREKIAERTTRARRNKVADGHVMVHSNPPYGYTVTETNGKRALVITETEARVVRLIFTLYTVGDGENGPLSMYAIAKRLTEERIPTRADTDPKKAKRRGYGEWSRASLGFIVGNETYAGTWHYGKYNYKAKATRNPREKWIPVQVPAIVSRETWELAQRRKKENRKASRRNTKHDYLLRRRVICGECSTPMNAAAHHSRGKIYLYYRCLASYGAMYDYAHTCTQRKHFRADHVDATVWDWVWGLFSDPEVALKGLQEEQATREEANKPLCDRLAVIDDLLTDNRAQLERALDLYLAGDFPREILTERKERLQSTIKALEWERADLAARLEAQTLTDEQIESVIELIARVRKGLEKAEHDFAKQRQLIEELDLWATLAIEDEQKVAHVRCYIGQDTLLIASNTTTDCCP